MEIQGKIERIEQEKQVTDKFKKREFVIATDLDTDYPQYIALECVQDKCPLLDNFSVGADVTVQVNVRGRNWTSPKGELRTFNTLQAWKIDGLSASEPIGEIPQDESDDLPF